MCKHEDKYCPRCNRLFECKAGNISQCQCNDVHLSVAAKKLIEEQYNDCLCASCLLELSKPSAVTEI